MCEEDLPILRENEPNSALTETHVSIDTVNDYAYNSDDSEEAPTLEYLLTSLRF